MASSSFCNTSSSTSESSCKKRKLSGDSPYSIPVRPIEGAVVDTVSSSSTFLLSNSQNNNKNDNNIMRTKDDNHRTCMVGGNSVLNFQNLGLLLRDAQWLKFNRPDSHWAPDVKELHHLRPFSQMRACLSITLQRPQQQQQSPPMEKFWVLLTNLVVSSPTPNTTCGPDHVPHQQNKNQQRVVYVGQLQDNLKLFNLHKGETVAFEARHVTNVDHGTARTLSRLRDEAEMPPKDKAVDDMIKHFQCY